MPQLRDTTAEQPNSNNAQTHASAIDLGSLLNDGSQPPAYVPATRTDVKPGPSGNGASQREPRNKSNRVRQARYRKNLKVPCSVFCVLGCSVLIHGLVPTSKLSLSDPVMTRTEHHLSWHYRHLDAKASSLSCKAFFVFFQQHGDLRLPTLFNTSARSTLSPADSLSTIAGLRLVLSVALEAMFAGLRPGPCAFPLLILTSCAGTANRREAVS